MRSFAQMKKQAEALMAQSQLIAKKMGFESVALGIGQTLAQFRQKQMIVVTVGEARRGKSSLLNALLDCRQSIFPVDVNVCTNVVTILCYGREEKLEVAFADGKCETFPLAGVDIADYVSEQGNPGNYKNVRVLKVYLPLEVLKEGLMFVDTPGVGSLNIAHAETTYAFLPNADLLIFVSDASAGLTESELNFLKRGYRYCSNVLFALTKKDLHVQYETILADNRTKIHHALGLPEEEIHIVPVSSAAKLRYLQCGRKTLYVNSNYQQLEQMMWDTIARTRASAVIMPFLTQVREQLSQIQDSMAAQYQMLHAGQDKTQQLIDQLNKEIEQQKGLQEQSAQWRMELSNFTTSLGYQVNPMVQQTNIAAGDCLQNAIAQWGDKICEESNYMQVLGDINHIISCKILDIRNYLEKEITDKCGALQKELLLDVKINQTALQKLDFKPDQTLSVTFPKRRISDRIISSGRTIGSTSFAFAAVGSVLGGLAGMVLGGPVVAVAGAKLGGAVGGAAGSAMGCVDVLHKYDQLDQNCVTRAIHKHITLSISGMNASINSTTAELRIGLSALFEQKLKQRTQTMMENIDQLKENIRISKAEVPGRLKAVQQQSDCLQKLLSQLQVMEEQLEQLSDPIEGQQAADTPTQADQPIQKPGPTYGFL